MAAPFIIPFDNNQTSDDFGNPGRTYTCPAGKYARVTVTLSAIATGNITAASAVANDAFGTSNNSNATSFEIWVTAAQVVSVTTVEASNTNTGTGPAFRNAAATTTSSCLVDSNLVGEINASAKAFHQGGGAGTTTVIVDGSGAANFHVAEYNIIS